MADKGRKLKASGSNPDAPARKLGKADASNTEAAEMPVDSDSSHDSGQSSKLVQVDTSSESVAAMLATIMKDIKEVKRNQRKEEAKAQGNQEEMRSEIQEAAKKAEHAAEAASQAKEATSVRNREDQERRWPQGCSTKGSRQRAGRQEWRKRHRSA